jgi:hypothetical protein
VLGAGRRRNRAARPRICSSTAAGAVGRLGPPLRITADAGGPQDVPYHRSSERVVQVPARHGRAAFFCARAGQGAVFQRRRPAEHAVPRQRARHVLCVASRAPAARRRRPAVPARRAGARGLRRRRVRVFFFLLATKPQQSVLWNDQLCALHLRPGGRTCMCRCICMCMCMCRCRCMCMCLYAVCARILFA